MNDIVVRRLRPEDADVISRISAAITRSPDNTDFRRIVEKQTQSDDDASFVAERENRLVGYCVSYILPGSFGVEKSAWVAVLGVDPGFMGQGIGEMMATEVLKNYKAQGIKYVYTSVRWDSMDLLSF
ncbi:MAG: GNAT family N-acetyltransferase, partial [Syntrophobacteraceae bacterium CG23_combo_of_CG06-09_8_20_14_all_50_8]